METAPLNRPTNKNELLQQLHSEYNTLVALLERIPLEQKRVPISGSLSVKDILAHIIDWEAWMLRCIRSAAVGEFLPPRSSTVTELAPDDNPDSATDAVIDAINAEIYERYRDADWETIWDEFRRTHEESVVEIEQMSESDLFDPQRAQAVTGRDFSGAAVDFIIGDTSEHYREHAIELRAAFSL